MKIYITRPPTYDVVARGSGLLRFWLSNPIPQPIHIEEGREEILWNNRDEIVDGFMNIDYSLSHVWVSSLPSLNYKQFKVIVGDDFDFNHIWQMVSHLYDVEDIGDGSWLCHVQDRYDALSREFGDVEDPLYLANIVIHTLAREQYIEEIITPGSTYMDWVGEVEIDIKAKIIQ